MSEDLSQKISQFLDDELNHDEAMHLLQKIRLQPELQEKLYRFEAISHALKTGDYLPIQTGFTEAVRLGIQQEPSYFLPQYKPSGQWFKPLTMAASIIVATVMVGYSLKQPSGPATIATQAVTLKATPKTVSTKPLMTAQQKPLNVRINDYLQAHKSSVYANDDNQYRPIARVTAYSQK